MFYYLHNLTIYLISVCYIKIGDYMKRKIILSLFVILSGVVFTFYFLNKKVFYAKEEYYVYAFQAGAYQNEDNANKYIDSLGNIKGIIIKDNDLYKIYVGIYKNTDIVNKMLVYFENNNINIYLKSIKVSKDFYKILDNYEKIINNTDNTYIYSKVNESILKVYYENN